MDDDVRSKTELDAVVALVDAKHLPLRLKDSREAEDQIAFADVVLINKIDLVDALELAALEATIGKINPYVTIHHTSRANIALDKILERGAFDLKRTLENDPHFLDSCHDDHDHDHDHDHECDHHHHHHHDHANPSHDVTVQSVSLRGEEMIPNLFFTWLQQVTQAQGPDILRLKGIIAFKDDPERYVVQGVHMILEGDHQRAWGEDEARISRLVFIGRNLDEDALKAGFKSCQL